jgi:hypothetical protein
MTSPPLPLPEGWSTLEVVADTIQVEGISISRAGVASRAPDALGGGGQGEELTGSAASLEGDPGPRASFELLERVAILDAIARGGDVTLRDAEGSVVGSLSIPAVFPATADPKKSRFARSNGVAIHRSWSAAASRAHAELVERDHVLRSWYGWERPERVSLDGAPTIADDSAERGSWPVETGTRAAYEWRAYRFGTTRAEPWTHGVEVRGVFGIPLSDGVPFIAGYGARLDAAEALEAAKSEATQLLAFLWGEALPTELPASAPHAGAHLERLLYPGHRQTLVDWLEGQHTMRPDGPLLPTPARASSDDGEVEVVFADLTQSFLAGQFAVAAAIHPRALRLRFGEGPETASLPPELRLHPIA